MFLILHPSDSLSDHFFPTAETSPVTSQTTTDDPLHKCIETVGKVQPHTEAKIVDLNGDIVPIGVRGEFHVAESGYLQLRYDPLLCSEPRLPGSTAGATRRKARERFNRSARYALDAVPRTHEELGEHRQHE